MLRLMRNARLIAVAAAIVGGSMWTALPARASDAGKIDGYVTPYYNSAGPVVRVGKYSAGLASSNESQLVATTRQMSKRWNQLNFVELYVGATRLYDMGYRNEATYWFYTAQYRGRLFAALIDQKKMGTIGSPGFELYHAEDAFPQLAGPNVNGYAFGNIDSLMKVIRQVQHENRNVPNMTATYPGVSFIGKSQWNAKNQELNSGLSKFSVFVVGQKAQIASQRSQNGTQARFAHLTSKRFPGGF
ncbi:MAG TPA: hypothetical protein VHR97_10715 [Candidatus Baltobacteraceae bacterium]|jgi:hypothetical protein|nr:hypothetical protein [Candidatus Baltobacteraceae bacterium]